MLKYLTKRFLRDNWVKIGNYYFKEHEGMLSVMKYKDFEKYGDEYYITNKKVKTQIQYEYSPVDTPNSVFDALDNFKIQGLDIQLAPYQLDLLILGICYEDMFKIIENSSLIDKDTINQYNNYFSLSTKRQSLSKSLRYNIFKRDNFTCQLCGRTPQDDGVKLEIDHIIPVSKGGTNDMSNLQTLCFDCNRGKSNKLI